MESKMKLLKVELNYAEVGKLLKSEEIGKACKAEADKIAARCGDGYATDTSLQPTRVIASAYTASTEAMKDNLDKNTLLKALGGGGFR